MIFQQPFNPFPPATPFPSMKENYLFMKEIKNLVNKAGCELKVCSGYINRGDRWMQVGGHQREKTKTFSFPDVPPVGFPPFILG